VADLQRAIDFYARTLGLKLLYRADDHFAMIDAGRGLLIGLHPPGAPRRLRAHPAPSRPG
jgi:catechol 2,3-dioxygenase-like lactoylglutathione lyase family enzyme